MATDLAPEDEGGGEAERGNREDEHQPAVAAEDLGASITTIIVPNPLSTQKTWSPFSARNG